MVTDQEFKRAVRLLDFATKVFVTKDKLNYPAAHEALEEAKTIRDKYNFVDNTKCQDIVDPF